MEVVCQVYDENNIVTVNIAFPPWQYWDQTIHDKHRFVIDERVMSSSEASEFPRVTEKRERLKRSRFTNKKFGKTCSPADCCKKSRIVPKGFDFERSSSSNLAPIDTGQLSERLLETLAWNNSDPNPQELPHPVNVVCGATCPECDTFDKRLYPSGELGVVGWWMMTDGG